MTYINFTKIAPPAPNDPTVNEVTQLNNNWDEMERVLSTQQGLSPVVNPEAALEVIDLPNNKFRVHDGTVFNTADSIKAAWTSWNAVALLAPIVPRSGFTVRYRSNPILRRVEVHGAVQNGSTPASFGTATFTLTADTGGIPDSLKPVGSRTLAYSCAGAFPISGNTVTGSRFLVSANPTPGNSVRIQGRYLGVSDGTSSLILDGIAWWY